MKKSVRTIIILSIVGLVLTGGTITGVLLWPKIKEDVQNIITNIIIDNHTNNDLTPLQKVSNINFVEETRMLTFGEVEGATNYEIYEKNIDNNSLYFYTATSGNLEVSLPKNSITGQTLLFTIEAIGDGIKTCNSELASYEYTLQYETDRLYNTYTTTFYETVEDILDYYTYSNAELISIDTINYQDNKFYVKGLIKDYLDKNYYFNIASTTNTLVDFNSPDVIALISGSIGHTGTLSYDSTAGYTNMTSGLLLGNSNTFNEYKNNGYNISMLQQTNSSVTTLTNGDRSLTVNGIYQATKQDEKVTFELGHTVVMPFNSESNTNSEYLQNFNETGNAVITDGTVNTYNADLMHHLDIMKEYHEAQLAEQNN